MSWTYQYLITYCNGTQRVCKGAKTTPEGAMVALSAALPKGNTLDMVTGISLQIAPTSEAETVVEATPAHSEPRRYRTPEGWIVWACISAHTLKDTAVELDARLAGHYL
jgi:hypothetical protein